MTVGDLLLYIWGHAVFQNTLFFVVGQMQFEVVYIKPTNMIYPVISCTQNYIRRLTIKKISRSRKSIEKARNIKFVLWANIH